MDLCTSHSVCVSAGSELVIKNVKDLNDMVESLADPGRIDGAPASGHRPGSRGSRGSRALGNVFVCKLCL